MGRLSTKDYMEATNKYGVRWLYCQEAPSMTKHKTLWVCSCGNIFSSTHPSIVRKHYRCGCGYVTEAENRFKKAPNIDGQKFHKLLVLYTEFKRSSQGQKTLCRCRCDCGKEVYITRNNIVTGSTKSCGCTNDNEGKHHHLWKGGKYVSSAQWGNIRSNSCRKNKILDFNISLDYIDDLLEKQEFKCALSGTVIQCGDRNGRIETTASLDRIDSTKGYIVGNVQWIHKDINKMKMNFPEDRFTEWCHKISQYLLSRG